MSLPDDETVDKLMADPAFRDALTFALAHAGVTTPIEELDREELRHYVASAMSGLEAATADDVQLGSSQADEIPDQLVDEALAEPQVRDMLESVLRENGFNVPIEELPKSLIKRLLLEMFQYAQSAGDPPTSN